MSLHLNCYLMIPTFLGGRIYISHGVHICSSTQVASSHFHKRKKSLCFETRCTVHTDRNGREKSIAEVEINCIVTSF